MKHAGPTIERVLTSLREAEPPAGMERRILHALETRGTAASLSPWHIRTRLACAVVVAAMGIVTVTVSWRPREPARLLIRPSMTQTVALPKAPPPPRPVHMRRHTHLPHLQAAGYPAPPLPLTEQERLLLRLAHRRDRPANTILDDDLRAAQTAKATHQFEQFFGMDAKEMRSQVE